MELLSFCRQCPSCHCDHIVKFFERKPEDAKSKLESYFFSLMGVEFKPVRFDYCEDCGLLFQNPRWSDEGVKQLYGEKNVYRRASLMAFRESQGSPDAQETDIYRFIDISLKNRTGVHPTHLQRALWIREALKLKSGDKAHIVDVGAGFGAAQKALEHAGFEYSGYESSPDVVRFANENGRTVKVSPFHEIGNLMERKADIVYTSQFLEHVDKPVDCLNVLRSVLKPDGVVFVDVPTFEMFPFQVTNFVAADTALENMNWGHMSHFNHISLNNAFRLAGLEPIAHRYVKGDIWALARLSDKPLPLERPSKRLVRANIEVAAPLLTPVATAYRNYRQVRSRLGSLLRPAESSAR